MIVILQIGIISTLPVGMTFVGSLVFSFLVDMLRAKRILSTGAARKLATAIGRSYPWVKGDDVC